MNARDRILEAACELIHTQGYHATTMDQVVDTSGLSKGTLYHHFSTKEVLAQAALDRFFSLFSERIREAMERRAEPLARLGALMDTVVEIQQEIGLLGCPLGNLALELSCSHEGFRQRLQLMLGMMSGEVERCLRRAARSGGLRPEVRVRRAARFVLAAIQGGVLLAKTDRDIRPLEDCVEEAKLYLEGLRSTGGEGAGPA